MAPDKAAAPAPAEPAPAPAAPAPASFAAVWGSVSFDTPPRSVSVRAMLIPESVALAARVLVEALDTARATKPIALDIGAGDGRAWPRELERNIANCEFLRLAVRRELERRGYRIAAGTPAAGVWQVSPIYGRDTIHWRFRVVAPKRQ
jgi:hypothetical protein